MQVHVARTKTVLELSELQKLVESQLSGPEVKQWLRNPLLWHAPKDTDQMYRQHARLIDRLLGLNVMALESALVSRGRSQLPTGSYEYWGPAIHGGTQTWVGLDPQTLNTPYAVLYRICGLLKLAPGQVVVDLGAGLGRLGVVMNCCARSSEFLGLEYVPERVAAANQVYQRWGMTQAQCRECDLFAQEFQLPEADVYFIYDYGRHDHINATLAQLKTLAEQRPFKLVGRGQATNRLISLHHPWLESHYEGAVAENFKIYHPVLET